MLPLGVQRSGANHSIPHLPPAGNSASFATLLIGPGWSELITYEGTNCPSSLLLRPPLLFYRTRISPGQDWIDPLYRNTGSISGSIPRLGFGVRRLFIFKSPGTAPGPTSVRQTLLPYSDAGCADLPRRLGPRRGRPTSTEFRRTRRAAAAPGRPGLAS